MIIGVLWPKASCTVLTEAPLWTATHPARAHLVEWPVTSRHEVAVNGQLIRGADKIVQVLIMLGSR